MERRKHTDIPELLNDFAITKGIDYNPHRKTSAKDLQAINSGHVRRGWTGIHHNEHESRLEDSFFENQLPLCKDINFIRKWLLEVDAVTNQPDHPTSGSLNLPSSQLPRC